jgi:hypothetical protein
MYNETRLEADNSKIAYLVAYDQSLSKVSNSSIKILLIDQKSSAYVQVSNSTINTLALYSGVCVVEKSTVDFAWFPLMSGSYHCKLSLSKNETMWNIKRDGGGIPCDLTLQNTLLREFMIFAYNSTLDIRDSNLYSLSVYGRSNVSITNCTTNIYFGNSTVEAVEISDSRIGRLEGEWEAIIKKLFIEKSVIGVVSFTSPTIKELYIEESVISTVASGLGEYTRVDRTQVGSWWSFTGQEGSTRFVEISDSSFGNFTINPQTAYSFRNVTVNGYVWVDYSLLIEPSFIRGDVTIKNESQVYELNLICDAYSRVTREYDVSVTRGGVFLPEAYMELQSGNETIWKGESDSEGKARFNVTYTGTYVVNPVLGQPPLVNEGNMTRTLTLLVKDRGDTAVADLSLLCDTPVKIGFNNVYSGFQLQLFAILFFLALVLVVVYILIRLRVRV